MKRIFNLLSILGLASFVSASNASAASFTNFYVFSAGDFASGPNPQATNSDGINPDGFLLSGNTLYGTAAAGGLYGYGTVFRVDTNGKNFTNLFNFNLGTFDSTTVTYPDSTGDMPNSGLLLISNTLYGTTFYGGLHDAGTVFKINTDGSGFALIHAFNFTDGQSPSSGLTLYQGVLYGTTAGGGSNQDGTVFSIGAQGFANVYNFTNQEEPYGGVVVSSNIIYGFGRYGGAYSNGVVYSVGIGGGGHGDLLEFDGTNGSSAYSTPILSGNTLFGVTYQGGTNGGGNVFRINTDGQGYTNLYNFPRQSGANTTGSNPYDFGGLVLSGNKLYGTTSVSGSGGQGTVFQLDTDGTGFSVLHSFQYTDGSQPFGLVLSGGTLYGMTEYGFQGFSLGDGGLFSLVLQPTLNLSLAGNQAVLTWNDASYSLYTAPTITNTFTK